MRKAMRAYWAILYPLSLHCTFGEIKYKSRGVSTCPGATQVSVRLASVQGFVRLVDYANGRRFAKFYVPCAIKTSQSRCLSILAMHGTLAAYSAVF